MTSCVGDLSSRCRERIGAADGCAGWSQSGVTTMLFLRPSFTDLYPKYMFSLLIFGADIEPRIYYHINIASNLFNNFIFVSKAGTKNDFN